MTPNPYMTYKGFGLRVYRAEKMLRRFAVEFGYDIRTRSFENCFEMYDGDAVTFALMDKAKAELHQSGHSTLADGIRKLFPRSICDSGFPDDWEEIYQKGSAYTQLSFSCWEVV